MAVRTAAATASTAAPLPSFLRIAVLAESAAAAVVAVAAAPELVDNLQLEFGHHHHHLEVSKAKHYFAKRLCVCIYLHVPT